MGMREDFKKAFLFCALACALAWGLVSAFRGVGGAWMSAGGVVVGMVMMSVPLLSAVIVQKVVWRKNLWSQVGFRFRWSCWLVVAWFAMAVLSAAAMGVSLLFPGVEFTPDMAGMFVRYGHLLTPEQADEIRAQLSSASVHPAWGGIAASVTLFTAINALFAFGEEAGWRGYLLKQLAFLGFWRCSLVTGLVWGLWHFPAILAGHNYPHHPVSGVFLMLAWCVLLAPLHTYVTLKARTCLAAVIMHGSLNATAGLSFMLLSGHEVVVGIMGIAGLIVLVLANVVLYLYDKHVADHPAWYLMDTLATDGWHALRTGRLAPPSAEPD